MVVSVLGRGAFGDVYEGSLNDIADGSHRTSVAIKVLLRIMYASEN